MFLVCSSPGEFCHHKVPILLGLARALGRTPDKGNMTPLLCQLYPRPGLASPITPQGGSGSIRSPLQSRSSSPHRAFSTFRSIVPRSMSHNILTSSASQNDLLSPNYVPRQQSPSPSETLSSDTKQQQQGAQEVIDPRTHYFDKVGSTFPQDGESWENGEGKRPYSVDMTTAQLQTILNLVEYISTVFASEVSSSRCPSLLALSEICVCRPRRWSVGMSWTI